MGNAPGSPSSEKSYFDSIDETACQSDDYFDEKGKLPRYKIVPNKGVTRRFSTGDPPLSRLTVPTMFKWKKEGTEVFLMGSFDGWVNRIPLFKNEDESLAVVELPIGVHTYKYLVDGAWRYDSDEPTVENEIGSLNNILRIKESDFEIFKALAADDNPINDLNDSDFGHITPVSNNPHQRPPLIPPHLLQIVLNKENNISQKDPSILPLPHTAELNHLHALSIRGGVITMSSTHRYKKKYITTLFYQPTS